MIYIYNPTLSDSEIQNFSGGTYRYGPEIWTLITYQNLINNYSNIKLVNKVPDSGIILSHNDYLDEIIPNENHYLVSIQADRHMSKNAHSVIVQNRDQLWQRFLFHKVYFVKHWPEKNVIKRDSNRKGLKTIKYVGNPANLDKYFTSIDWLSFCSENNLVWEIVNERNKWSDFTDIDLLIAVREFGNKKIKHKPATKLFNAWIANVPIIVGSNETAYKHEKEYEYDFIAVDSIEKFKNKILELINNMSIFEKYISQSILNEEKVSIDKIAQDWVKVFKQIELDSNSYSNSNWVKLKVKTLNVLKKVKS